MSGPGALRTQSETLVTFPASRALPTWASMGGAEGTSLRERLEAFSLVSGGVFSRVLDVLHLGGLSRGEVARRCAALMAVGWVPLLVATIAEGTAMGGPGSFLWDVGTHVRLLFALPLLLVAERAIDRRTREGLAHLEEAGIVADEHTERVERVLAVASRARDSRVAELAIVAVVIGMSVNDVVLAPVTPHWMFVSEVTGSPEPRLAGWIELALSAPLYRVVLLQWLWRLVVWALLLGGLARMGVRISALHADEVGGLGVLSEAHKSFGWLVAALGATLAGNFTGQRMLLHGSVAAYTHSIVVFCFVAPALCLAPMLAFAWPLELAKRRAHREYSVIAADFARRYGRAHLDRERPVPIAIGSADPSSAEDLGGSFERMLATRWLPLDRNQFAFLFACAFLPMIPFYLQELPLTEIVKRLRDVLG